MSLKTGDCYLVANTRLIEPQSLVEIPTQVVLQSCGAKTIKVIFPNAYYEANGEGGKLQLFSPGIPILWKSFHKIAC